MAKMIPSVEVRRGVRGEKKFYRAIKEKLPDSFLVFHSLEHVGIDPQRGLEVGEIDFLLVHRKYGMMVVEVKGGKKIEYQPEKRAWYSWNLKGEKKTIKNPFRQAKDNMHALKDKILDSGVFGSRELPFAYCYCVSFPDTTVTSKYLPLDSPRALILDASDLAEVRHRVPQVFEGVSTGRKKREMTAREFEDLRDRVLMPGFQVACSVGLELKEEKEEMKRLTAEQFKLLDYLGDRKQAIIEGRAGTGKTFLAVEKARRLALDGRRVLLVCFNNPLARHISSLVKGQGTWSELVKVDNFHNLCIMAAKEAGLEFEFPPEGDQQAVREFWEDTTPLLLLDAAEKLGLSWDALVVDEAQDFRSDWLEVLMQQLEDGEDGYCYFFHDPEQDIFCRDTRFPIKDEPFKLSFNCRNTRRVAGFIEEVGGFSYQRLSESIPGGEVCTWQAADPGDMADIVDRIVRNALESGFEPSQVAVLSPCQKQKSCLAERDAVGGIQITTNPLELGPASIRFSTLRRFKGLEAEIIVFTDVDGSEDVCDRKNQYAAVSRARHTLHVVHYSSWSPPGKGKSRKGRLPGYPGNQACGLEPACRTHDADPGAGVSARPGSPHTPCGTGPAPGGNDHEGGG